MIKRAIALGVLAAVPALAQSTSSLYPTLRRPSVQVTGGIEPQWKLAGNVAIQTPARDGMAVRGDVWLSHTTHTTSWSSGSDTRRTEEKRFRVPIGISLVVPYRISPNLKLDPAVGIGVHAVNHIQSLSSTSTGSTAAYDGDYASPGWFSSVGLTLRWRHLVVQQHVLGLLDSSLFRNGERMPLMIGVVW